MHYWTYCI